MATWPWPAYPSPGPITASGSARLALDMLAAVRQMSRGDRLETALAHRYRDRPGHGRRDRRRQVSYEVWGDTVNLAARLERQAQSGQILDLGAGQGSISPAAPGSARAVAPTCAGWDWATPGPRAGALRTACAVTRWRPANPRSRRGSTPPCQAAPRRLWLPASIRYGLPRNSSAGRAPHS